MMMSGCLNVRVLTRVAPLLLVLLHLHLGRAAAKLYSSALERDEAKEIIKEIFRQTHLDEDQSFWGERYREDIERLSKVFSMNYYLVFANLKINKAMARCAVYAKYESDYERWLREMDRFDEAAEKLNRRDRGRYYFAKGLAKIRTIPNKIRDLPEGFYKAAENGYASTFLADYIVKGSSGVGDAAEVFTRLAESYRRGEALREAYKFYLLAAKLGKMEPAVFLDMVEVAYAGDSERLAYKTALVFLEAFSVYGGARRGNKKVLDALSIGPGMSADALWLFCESSGFDSLIGAPNTSHASPQSESVKPRDLNKFDSRYVQPMSRNMGMYDDLLEIAVCEKYWLDSAVVKRFLPRISSGIDSHDGMIRSFAGKVRSDERFSGDAKIALWEARRWKAADKLEEFAAKFPKRHKLAGLADR